VGGNDGSETLKITTIRLEMRTLSLPGSGSDLQIKVILFHDTCLLSLRLQKHRRIAKN